LLEVAEVLVLMVVEEVLEVIAQEQHHFLVHLVFL
jgi:hypothetical protein